MAYLMHETVISDINLVRVVVSYSIKHEQHKIVSSHF